MLCSPSLMTDAWRSDRINASSEKGVCAGSERRLGSKLQRQVEARRLVLAVAWLAKRSVVAIVVQLSPLASRMKERNAGS